MNYKSEYIKYKYNYNNILGYLTKNKDIISGGGDILKYINKSSKFILFYSSEELKFNLSTFGGKDILESNISEYLLNTERIKILTPKSSYILKDNENILRPFIDNTILNSLLKTLTSNNEFLITMLEYLNKNSKVKITVNELKNYFIKNKEFKILLDKKISIPEVLDENFINNIIKIGNLINKSINSNLIDTFIIIDLKVFGESELVYENKFNNGNYVKNDFDFNYLLKDNEIDLDLLINIFCGDIDEKNLYHNGFISFNIEGGGRSPSLSSLNSRKSMKIKSIPLKNRPDRPIRPLSKNRAASPTPSTASSNKYNKNVNLKKKTNKISFFSNILDSFTSIFNGAVKGNDDEFEPKDNLEAVGSLVGKVGSKINDVIINKENNQQPQFSNQLYNPNSAAQLYPPYSQPINYNTLPQIMSPNTFLNPINNNNNQLNTSNNPINNPINNNNQLNTSNNPINNPINNNNQLNTSNNPINNNNNNQLNTSNNPINNNNQLNTSNNPNNNPINNNNNNQLNTTNTSNNPINNNNQLNTSNNPINNNNNQLNTSNNPINNNNNQLNTSNNPINNQLNTSNNPINNQLNTTNTSNNPNNSPNSPINNNNQLNTSNNPINTSNNPITQTPTPIINPLNSINDFIKNFYTELANKQTMLNTKTQDNVNK